MALDDLAGLGEAGREENAWAAAPSPRRRSGVSSRCSATTSAAWPPEQVLPMVDVLPGWSMNYVRVGPTAHVLWLLGRAAAGNAEMLERNIRTKIVEPDFRFPSFARSTVARPLGRPPRPPR